MKYKIFIVLLLTIIVSCNNYSKKSVLLIENEDYIVYTSKKNLKEVFEEWFEEQKNNHSVIEIDKTLYEEIIKQYSEKPTKAYQIANNLNKIERLNYRTADLLELKKAYVYNKRMKRNEKVNVVISDTDREFIVNNYVVLKIIDKIY